MAYMTERCKSIINILLGADTWTTLTQIENVLGISKRSVYYDLCRINEWLEENNIATLEIKRNKGIWIPSEIKEKIERISGDTEEKEYYIWSPMERVHIIICSIIFTDTPIYIEQLIDYCQVSRNTIFSDLKVVTNQLKDYDLTLEYKSKTGYFISGDVIKIRAVFLMHIYELEKSIGEKSFPFAKKTEIQKNFAILKEIEKGLNIKYVEKTLLSLSALIPIMLRGKDELHFDNLKQKEIESTREWFMIQKYFPTMNYHERIYLCLHFLGARVAVADTDIFEEKYSQAYELTKSLVAEFEKKACVLFSDREELERQLFIHINSSLYRYQYGIQVNDTMCDDIIREYPDLFDITKLVCHYLEQQIGLKIPDNEIAYIALHFGAHLSIANKDTSKLRILIVCVNGISTGNMLKKEISKLLPYAEIVNVIPLSTVQNVQDICDIVISTVKMKCVIPSILVHPILTQYDKELILNHPRIRANMGKIDIQKLFDVIEPFLIKEKRKQAMQAIQNYLGKEVEQTKENVMKSLTDVLCIDNIAIKNNSYTWTEAIREAGKPLLYNKSIEGKYIDSIISQIRYYGPYMFITPRVMLAHTKPEDGVNCLGISLFVYKNAVYFSDFHEANIIIILAAEDQEKHLKALGDIAKFFSIQARIDNILSMDSSIQILKYISDSLELEKEKN